MIVSYHDLIMWCPFCLLQKLSELGIYALIGAAAQLGKLVQKFIEMYMCGAKMV